MKPSVALRLGRVSNLPTVWSNTLAGVALAGGEIAAPHSLILLAAFSLFYVGGMLLNDAFDHRIDRSERPERPIPSGELRPATAFAAGFALLGGGLLLLLRLGFSLEGGAGWRILSAGLVLGLLIVLYDWRHKEAAWSPFLMGVCRALVYLIAGFAFLPLPPVELWLGAAALFAYVTGLTAIARGEAHRLADSPKGAHLHTAGPFTLLGLPLFYGLSVIGDASGVLLYVVFLLWTAFALWHVMPKGLTRDGAVLSGRVETGRAVAWLIAGIPLLDALLIAGTGAAALAWLAAAASPLTLILQRRIPGT